MKKIAILLALIATSCKEHDEDYYSYSGETLEETAVVGSYLCDSIKGCSYGIYPFDPGRMVLINEGKNIWLTTVCDSSHLKLEQIGPTANIYITGTKTNPAKKMPQEYSVRVDDKNCLQIGTNNQEDLEELCLNLATTQDFKELELEKHLNCQTIQPCSKTKNVFCIQ